MMNLIAGNKLVLIVALVLAVGLTSYFVIQYIQEGAVKDTTIQLQEEKEQKRNTVRDQVNESVGRNAPTNDATDSLRWFKDRQAN